MWFQYWINENPICDVTIFVKGAQNVQFSCHIFPKISEILKAHIFGTETDINKRYSWFLTVSHISQ